MHLLDRMLEAVALLLAIAVAVVSSLPTPRQDLSGYISEVLAPRMADLGNYTNAGWEGQF